MNMEEHNLFNYFPNLALQKTWPPSVTKLLILLQVLSLESTAGLESVRCMSRTDLKLDGSFADMILIPDTGVPDKSRTSALFIFDKSWTAEFLWWWFSIFCAKFKRGKPSTRSTEISSCNSYHWPQHNGHYSLFANQKWISKYFTEGAFCLNLDILLLSRYHHYLCKTISLWNFCRNFVLGKMLGVSYQRTWNGLWLVGFQVRCRWTKIMLLKEYTLQATKMVLWEYGMQHFLF